MYNDATFLAKILNRLDNMDKYLEYLSDDYLPKTVKRINKNEKNLYADMVVLGSITVAGFYLFYKANKRLAAQLKDANEHIKALDERLDHYVYGDISSSPDEEE